MPQPIGRRDSRDDSWRWGPEGQPDPNGGRRRRRGRSGLILAAAGAVIAATGIAFLVLASAGDDNSSQGEAPTRTAVARASRTPGATAAPSSSPGLTTIPASPSPAASRDTLFIWSRQRRQWLRSDLAREDPGYREGEAVPFFLRIEDATSGSVYRVEIRYQCLTPAGAAFDYLTGVSEADIDALMMAPGPKRHEDASIPIPDDPAISFDPDNSRFHVWGGSFQQTPQGPLPTTPCQDEKRFRVNLMAQDDTLFLMWGAHLASSKDWGENRGASRQKSPVAVEASVDGGEREQVMVGPAAIAP